MCEGWMSRKDAGNYFLGNAAVGKVDFTISRW